MYLQCSKYTFFLSNFTQNYLQGEYTDLKKKGVADAKSDFCGVWCNPRQIYSDVLPHCIQ